MFVFAVVLLFTVLAIFLLRWATPNDQYGLTTFQLTLAFSFKILMGCAYGYIFLVKYDGDDTWWLHEYSLGQFDLLREDPWWFFAEMNPMLTFNRDDGLATNCYYYLADLELWLLTKPFAFLNFLSGGNYYINIIFFNLPVFFGHYWLFRMLRQKFAAPRWPLFAAVFLIPPVVFWLSGLRADGILFFLMMLAFRTFSKLIKHVAVKPIIIFLFSLAGIVIFRNVHAALILPAFVSWLIAEKSGRKALPVFTVVYGICIGFFLGNMLIWPDKNAASLIVNRQHEFFELAGNTRFNLDTLKPNAISFVQVLPQAANNTFLRPYPWEAKGILQYATVLEVLLFLMLIVLFVFRRIPGWKSVLNHPFTLTLLFFGISLYLFTGYVVPFPGAIVRYKIIGEIFFFAILACVIDWRRIAPNILNNFKIY